MKLSTCSGLVQSNVYEIFGERKREMDAFGFEARGVKCASRVLRKHTLTFVETPVESSRQVI